MFIKLASFVFSLLVAMTYCIGFLYDASFLEEFGINHYELLGSPLDYLSIGGMYLLFTYSEYITILFVALGIFGVAYVPLKRRISKLFIDNYVKNIIDIESLPYVVFSFSPLFILFLLPILLDAKTDSKEIRQSKSKDRICIIEGALIKCINGRILRYRDSKIVFYNNSENSVVVFADRNIVSATHGS